MAFDQESIRRIGEAVGQSEDAKRHPQQRPPKPEPQQAFAQRMKIKVVHGDYLECRRMDGTTEGTTTIYVAKRLVMQRQNWHNTTNDDGWLLTDDGTDGTTRTASKSGEDDLAQEVSPQYTVDDEIIAERIGNGTGVMVSGDNVYWMDGEHRTWCDCCFPMTTTTTTTTTTTEAPTTTTTTLAPTTTTTTTTTQAPTTGPP